MTTGMVSSYMNEVLALAEERDITIDDITLVQDNYYTMKGSALRGTMTGGVVPVDLEAKIDADADEETLRDLIKAATDTSPIHGLMQGERNSAFKLVLDGDEIETDDVTELDGRLLPTSDDPFTTISRDVTEQDPPLVHRTGETTEKLPDAEKTYTSGQGSSLQDEQDRILHLRGICTLRDDGMKNVEVKLYSPQGTIFELMSDELQGHGGQGRAPDAATYIAAGIGFCFMTQFGRYAEIVGKELSEYHIVQDTHFSFEAADVGTEQPGQAEPVETHVFLRTPEGEEFAREVLDMSEQTCFLHAFCRTDLSGPDVEVTMA